MNTSCISVEIAYSNFIENINDDNQINSPAL